MSEENIVVTEEKSDIEKAIALVKQEKDARATACGRARVSIGKIRY